MMKPDGISVEKCVDKLERLVEQLGETAPGSREAMVLMNKILMAEIDLLGFIKDPTSTATEVGLATLAYYHREHTI